MGKAGRMETGPLFRLNSAGGPMENPEVRDDLPIAEFTAASSSPPRATQADDRFQ